MSSGLNQQIPMQENSIFSREWNEIRRKFKTLSWEGKHICPPYSPFLKHLPLKKKKKKRAVGVAFRYKPFTFPALSFSPLCNLTPTNNLAYSDLMNDSARADGLILDYYWLLSMRSLWHTRINSIRLSKAPPFYAFSSRVALEQNVHKLINWQSVQL